MRKNLIKILSVIAVVMVSLWLVTEASAAVQPGGTGTPYGYATGGTCGMPYGMVPNTQYGIVPNSQYCIQYYPGRWVPVLVKIPGHVEMRPIWIPETSITLYRPIPGYWQRTVNGAPDYSVWQTQSGQWQGVPYQSQNTPANTPKGYFDGQGVWRPFPY